MSVEYTATLACEMVDDLEPGDVVAFSGTWRHSRVVSVDETKCTLKRLSWLAEVWLRICKAYRRLLG